MIKTVFNRAAFLAREARGRIPLLKTEASRVAYTETAPTTLQFFQSGFGASNKERNSAPSAGRLQYPFLVHSIECTYSLADEDHDGFVGTDATTLAADILMGFVQGGVLTLGSQGKTFLQVPRPLIHMPRRAGYPPVKGGGIKALVLTEATPNTYPGAAVSTFPAPHVSPGAEVPRPFMCDPMLFIPQDEPFELKLAFPAGALNVIATTPVDDSTNPLYIEVALRGEALVPQE